jgi:hypothetical protein
MKTIFGLLLFLFVSVYGQPLPVRTYEYDAILFPQQQGKFFQLYWTINEQTSTFQGAIVCQQVSPGWCGIGWSEFGSMIGSDAVLGSIEDDNVTATIMDFDLRAQTPPGNGTCPNAVCADSAPCADDVSNTSGRREGEYMVLEFDRPIAASDACDKPVPINVTDQFVIYGWGAGLVPIGVLRHSDRGFAQFDWQPPYDTTGALTTGGLTTSAVTSGEVTSAAIVTTSPGTTGVAPPATTGVAVGTTGVADGTTGDNVGGESSEGGRLFGLLLWQGILIIVGAALILIVIIIVIVVAVRKKKGGKKEYFGGFY